MTFRMNAYKISHWTIKVTWEDEHGTQVDVDHINDIPDWVAKPVDEFLDSVEEIKRQEWKAKE